MKGEIEDLLEPYIMENILGREHDDEIIHDIQEGELHIAMVDSIHGYLQTIGKMLVDKWEQGKKNV